MNKLNEIVDFYLTSETNYALMIKGEWGVGKTYYYNNILKEQIAKTSTYIDDKRKYKPIYISLFGLKSVEEIQSCVFLNLYPLLNNKTIKLAANIGKVLIKGIMSLKNIGNYYDFISEIDIEGKDWIQFEDLVICFDDLERISAGLNIEEFIGFVNSLVENENVKVLLIANENKISNENYFALKEKVVGNSIEFIPDFKETLNNIIEHRFQDYKTYRTFLKKKSEYIFNIFFANCTNLRILTYTLLLFHRIHSEYVLSFKELSILKTKQEEILENLLKFSIAIAIEYKLGNISYTKKNELNTIEVLNWSKLLPDTIFKLDKKEETQTKKSYKQEFIDKYYKEDKFDFFESIFDFYTGGALLNRDILVKDIKIAYHIESNKILPQYEILQRLEYPVVFELSEKKHKDLVKQMLDYAYKGNYDLKAYLTVFYFATRFGNPLRYNIKKLERKLINGMRLGQENFKYIRSLDFHLSIDKNFEFIETAKNIRKISLEINESILEHSRLITQKRLEDLCYNDFEKFYSEIEKDNNLLYRPIFHFIKPYKFYLLFLRSNNPTRINIIELLKSRYSSNPAPELLVESDFFEKLVKYLENKVSRTPKSGISSYLFQELNHITSMILRSYGINNK